MDETRCDSKCQTGDNLRDGNNFETLDLTNNPKLKILMLFGSKLTGLDLSKQTKLSYVTLQKNNFDAQSLDSLFETLNSNTDGVKIITASGNPGYDTCDKTIATKKGWRVQ